MFPKVGDMRSGSLIIKCIVVNSYSLRRVRDVHGITTKKDETFYLQSGLISLYYGYEDDLSTADLIVLTPGEKFHVPVGMRHQMVALNDTELFEFSTQHFDSDSYRVIKGD